MTTGPRRGSWARWAVGLALGFPSAARAEVAPKCPAGQAARSHVVREGDTLGAIARRHGTREAEIVARNPQLAPRPGLLRTGEELRICASRKPRDPSMSCGRRGRIHLHEVVPGEHLGQIAGRYGVRRRDLVRLNPSLRNPNLLRSGQKIRVCPEIAPRERARIEHTVQGGEHLGVIARRYGLTASELLRMQEGRLADPNALRVGRVLAVWVDGATLSGFGGADSGRGVLRGAVNLPPGAGYRIKTPSLGWATAKTVRLVQTALRRYRLRHPRGPDVVIGDLSRRGGGPLPPHDSHREGRDVDVGYVHKGGGAQGFRAATPENLDLVRTWGLVEAFIDTDEVVYIFMDLPVQRLLYEHLRRRGLAEDVLDELFQYPRSRAHGIIRDWDGHDDHFHVRFRG